LLVYRFEEKEYKGCRSQYQRKPEIPFVIGKQIDPYDPYEGKPDTVQYIDKVKGRVDLPVQEAEYIETEQIADKQKLKPPFYPFLHPGILESLFIAPNKEVGKNKSGDGKEHGGRNAPKVFPDIKAQTGGIPESIVQ
jgi:hypothetical protein